MRSFSTGIVIRICFITTWAAIGAWSWQNGNTGLLLLMSCLMLTSMVNLYHFTTTLNKKLSRIFDSIQYEDFAITFRADNSKGDSFEELNASLNAVIKSFNQVRAEREATVHFIDAATVARHAEALDPPVGALYRQLSARLAALL